MDVPVTQDRRDVSPRFGSQHPQEDSERCRTGTPEISRLATYIRDIGAPKRRGRENRIEYAGSFRRRLHAPHLHPRHTADAGKRSRKDGKLYGTGDVNKQQKTQSVGEDTTNILSAALWTFHRVGRGVGQANSLPKNPNK